MGVGCVAEHYHNGIRKEAIEAGRIIPQCCVNGSHGSRLPGFHVPSATRSIRKDLSNGEVWLS